MVKEQDVHMLPYVLNLISDETVWQKKVIMRKVCKAFTYPTYNAKTAAGDGSSSGGGGGGDGGGGGGGGAGRDAYKNDAYSHVLEELGLKLKALVLKQKELLANNNDDWNSGSSGSSGRKKETTTAMGAAGAKTRNAAPKKEVYDVYG